MIIIGGNKRDFFDHKSHKINIFVIKISFPSVHVFHYENTCSDVQYLYARGL